MQRIGRRGTLFEFKHNLDILLRECNTPVDEGLIGELNFYDIMSRIIPDSSLEGYIRVLNKEVIAAKKNLAKIKVDVWNNTCNEQRIIKLEGEMEAMKSAAADAERELDALKAENSALNEQLADMEKQQGECARETPADNSLIETVKALISHREDLLQNKKRIEENDPENVMLKRFVEQEIFRVEATLRETGAAVLNETGEFDKTRHTVVDTRITEDKELAGTIAETISSGYEYNGELLKNQEVVVYKKA